jgi:hypothetical protein
LRSKQWRAWFNRGEIRASESISTRRDLTMSNQNDEQQKKAP